VTQASERRGRRAPLWESSGTLEQSSAANNRAGSDTLKARYQFERLAYCCADGKEGRPGHMDFNRTITLKDTWARVDLVWLD
jgi:hypothetical protein